MGTNITQRHCGDCGHIFKEEDTKCIICHPNERQRPILPKYSEVKIQIKTKDWYCADCATKIPKAFQTCPICAKSHIKCSRCHNISPPAKEKKTMCQLCYNYLETTNALPEKIEPPQVLVPTIFEGELEEALEELQEEHEAQEPEKLEKPKAEPMKVERKPDGRKTSWTEERKAHQAELVRQGKAGRGTKKHRTKTEASEEALDI